MNKTLKLISVFLIAPFIGLGLFNVRYFFNLLPKYFLSDLAKTNVDKPLASVNQQKISIKDLDLEYDLLLYNYVKAEFVGELTANTKDFVDPELEFSEQLKKEIFYKILETKLLVEMIHLDKAYQAKKHIKKDICNEQSQEIYDRLPQAKKKKVNLEFISTKLCEFETIKNYLKNKLFQKIRIKESNLLSYYQDHPQEFIEPKSWFLRQIILSSEKKAKKLRRRVNYNNFSSLARSYSIAPEAKNGGFLGEIKRKNSLPHIFQSVFFLKKGEISKILKSTYGFHIIMVEDIKTARKQPFLVIRDKLRQKLYQEEKKRQYQKWLKLALNTVDIHFF